MQLAIYKQPNKTKKKPQISTQYREIFNFFYF
jgi:hypothetical protein